MQRSGGVPAARITAARATRHGAPAAGRSRAGLALGLALALALGRLLESVLYQVSPADPATLAGALATGLAVGVAASYLPAFRAARADPLAALRVE